MPAVAETSEDPWAVTTLPDHFLSGHVAEREPLLFAAAVGQIFIN